MLLGVVNCSPHLPALGICHRGRAKMARRREALLGLSSRKTSTCRGVERHGPYRRDLTQPITGPRNGRNGNAAVGWCILEASLGQSLAACAGSHLTARALCFKGLVVKAAVLERGHLCLLFSGPDHCGCFSS